MARVKYIPHLLASPRLHGCCCVLLVLHAVADKDSILCQEHPSHEAFISKIGTRYCNSRVSSCTQQCQPTTHS